MNIEEIRKLLPHRYPFLLVDRVLSYEVGKTIHAVKNVTFNEPFFQGHFPIQSVMPGVLIVEALAQAAGILAVYSEKEVDDAMFYLGGIESARFKKMVVPGDQLHLNVEIQKHKAQIWKFKGIATVDGDVVCTAEVTSAQGKRP